MSIRTAAVVLANCTVAVSLTLGALPTAAADPTAPPPADPSPAPVAGAPLADAPGADAPIADAPIADAPVADSGAASSACKQFNVALDYAASNYEDFAYNTAGGGNVVNYGDPIVADSNVTGRTALREAASSAMNAATTPGLPGDISAPMQAWSLHATKLLVVMGLHGGGNTLNDTANALNTDARNAQMACALAGVTA